MNQMATLTVGTNKQYQTVSSAIAASTDGDTILVDAGTYTNDFAHITTDITLTAVGGMVHMDGDDLTHRWQGDLCHQRQYHDQWV